MRGGEPRAQAVRAQPNTTNITSISVNSSMNSSVVLKAVEEQAEDRLSGRRGHQRKRELLQKKTNWLVRGGE